MAAITFDTLKFANTLKEAGVPPAQAEAEAEALSEVLEVNQLATKEDLHRESELLRRDMETLRADLKRDIAESKSELIRWVVGVGMLQITLIAALLLRLAPSP